MFNKRTLLIIMVIVTIIGFSFFSGLAMANGPEKSAEAPKKILKQLSPMEGEDVYSIPEGSVIKHLPSNLTEVYGPEGNLLLTVDEDEVPKIGTPGGFLLPVTRVHQVPSGSFVGGGSNGIIKVYGPNGKLILTIVDLSEDKYAASRPTRAPHPTLPPVPSPNYSGWIESAWDWYVASIQRFEAHWTCPLEPASPDDDDIVYLFPSIIGDYLWGPGSAIIQPVLDWNCSYTGGGRVSHGASWVVTESWGIHSSPIHVSQGDSIRGLLSCNRQRGWAINFWNETTGGYTYLGSGAIGWTDVDLNTALEGWYLEDTMDLYDDCEFTNMDFRDWGGGTIDIQWIPYYYDSYEGEHSRDVFAGLNVIIYDDTHTELETGRA